MTKKKSNSSKINKTKSHLKNFNFEYDPSLESTKIAPIKKSYDLFIDGKFSKPASGEYFESTNPSTGEVLTKLALAGESDVDMAVKSAHKAYSNVWSKMSGGQRSRFLFRIARILQERAREFAVLETLDGGKPIREARDVDIPLSAAHFFYYAGWADKLEYACPPGKFPKVLGLLEPSFHGIFHY